MKTTKIKLIFSRYNEEGTPFSDSLSLYLTKYQIEDLRCNRSSHQFIDLITDYLKQWGEEESFIGFDSWKRVNEDYSQYYAI